MTLLAFNYIISIALFFFAYYLDSRSERNNTIFSGLLMLAAFIMLLGGVTVHLLYFVNQTISLFVFQLCLITIGFFMSSLLRYSFAVPYYPRNVFVRFIELALLAFSAYLAFVSIEKISWNETSGFIVTSKNVFGMFDGFGLYAVVYFIALPIVSFFTLVIRGIVIRSRIFRQRLFFISLSLCMGMAIALMLYVISLTYFWVLPLMPVGLAVMLVLIHQSVSISILYDRAHVIATLANFFVLGLLYSVVVALVSAFAIEFIPYQIVVALALLVVGALFLTFRTALTVWFHRFVQVGTEYMEELETGLESLDFSAGGNEIVLKTVSLIEQHIDCASVDILVSDDKGKLTTVFSSSDSHNSLSITNKAIDFLLSRNETLLFKTQAITKHVYGEIKADLLDIFEIGNSDAFMLLREGHRVVGIILLGQKKHGGDYTEYDFSVITKLYSNFFLVMYYLKNIANESVVLTIDREIEFSGQIISGIQDNIDRIMHEKIDVDFITKSARKLGGDFIDFINLTDDKSLFVMGDVSGKGLNASMSMVILKSIFRTLLTETSDFKKLVIKVNSFVKNNLPKGTFFAGIFGLIDFSTNTLYYINCGVTTMFLYTAAYNNANEIQGEGRVLGFVRDISGYLKVKKITLNPQDILLLTTDGLVNATNLRGEAFGKDRVQRLLMDNRSYPAGRMAQFVCDNLADFVSRELEDDITVLVIKYLET